MEILVKGIRWTLRFTRLRGSADGWCYFTEKKILVCKKLRGVRRLDVIVHELLHAHNQSMPEHDVSRTASGVAKVLWDLGYRCLDDVELE